jgi:hypothetical protein
MKAQPILKQADRRERSIYGGRNLSVDGGKGKLNTLPMTEK